MTKFVDQQALLKDIENGIKAGNHEEGYGEYSNINDMGDIVDCIKYADTISEQDIVRPYLDKLIIQIQKLRGCSCSASDGIIDDIEDIIDNLLSEDGKKNS